MQIFARRAIDVARQAAVVAAAEGWLIEREADAHGAGPRPVGVPSGACASIVVSGGELRGPAVLMLAVRGEGDERGDWALVGIVSDHVPRTLPPPRLASMRGVRSRGLVARLIEHPALGTLDDILTRRGTLEAGEAATILIAVARGLADLHECGRAGVVLTPRCVGLREGQVRCAMCVSSCVERSSAQLRFSASPIAGSGGVGQKKTTGVSRKGIALPFDRLLGSTTITVTFALGAFPTRSETASCTASMRRAMSRVQAAAVRG